MKPIEVQLHKRFVKFVHENAKTKNEIIKICHNPLVRNNRLCVRYRVRILVQVTIYRRLLIGRDGHLDQSEAYDIS